MLTNLTSSARTEAFFPRLATALYTPSLACELVQHVHCLHCLQSVSRPGLSLSPACLATRGMCRLLTKCKKDPTFQRARPGPYRPGKVAENVYGLTFQNANDRAAAEVPSWVSVPCCQACLAQAKMLRTTGRLPMSYAGRTYDGGLLTIRMRSLLWGFVKERPLLIVHYVALAWTVDLMSCGSGQVPLLVLRLHCQKKSFEENAKYGIQTGRFLATLASSRDGMLTTSWEPRTQRACGPCRKLPRHICTKCPVMLVACGVVS